MCVDEVDAFVEHPGAVCPYRHANMLHESSHVLEDLERPVDTVFDSKESRHLFFGSTWVVLRKQHCEFFLFETKGSDRPYQFTGGRFWQTVHFGLLSGFSYGRYASEQINSRRISAVKIHSVA
jgi:hypothetical protein